MNNLTITSITAQPTNLTVTDNYNQSVSITSLNNTDINLLTINQGQQGPQGAPGDSFSIFANYGRLTLQSNDPLYNNNISGSILYYTPYLGNTISLYDTDTEKWQIYFFNQLSITLSNMTTSLNYDIFIYYNGTSLILEKQSWSNNTSRSVSLVYQNGILVKSNSLNKRYLGTIRSTSSSTTEDSSTKRFIFNINNQKLKILSCVDNIAHTYAIASVRSYRNNTSSGVTRVEFINGINNDVDINLYSRFTTESSLTSVGVGIDTISSFNTKAENPTYISFGDEALQLYNVSRDIISSQEGYHYLQLLQQGSTGATFHSALLRAYILC